MPLPAFCGPLGAGHPRRLVQPGAAANLLVNYNGVAAGAVTTANIATASLGSMTGSWSYLRSASSLLATTIEAVSVTRKWPLSVGGVNYATADRVIKFDLNGDDDAWEGLRRTVPAGNPNVIFTMLFQSSGVTGSLAMDIATVNAASGAFAVCQTSGNGGPVVFRSHGIVSSVTTIGRSATRPSTSDWYICTVHHDGANNRAEVIITDNATGAVLLVSSCASDLGGDASSFLLQNYLLFGGGLLRIALPAVVLGGTFPLDPVTIPAPSSVSAVQTANNQLTVSWSSVAQRFKVERSANAGASWSTLNANYDTVTNTATGAIVQAYADSTVTNTLTYRYRIAALAGAQESAGAASADVTVANSSNAPTTELQPSADTATGSWNTAPLWSKVNEPRSGNGTSSSITYNDVTAGTAAVLRYTTGSIGDVVSVKVYAYMQAFSGAQLRVEVSQDGTNWSSPQVMTPTGTTAEHTVTFSGLSWTNPTYVYVRIRGNGNTFDSLALYGLQIVLN